MSNSPTNRAEYVLGTHDAELARLGFQHRLWAEFASALWERAGFGPGKTILDVGCGPGFASFDLASLVAPGGKIISVDESARFIEHIREQQRARGVTNIDPRVSDVQRLELPPQSVDGAYARWVLCFVPDPEAVVARVADALRPGAAFAVQDYVYYRGVRLAPPCPSMERVIQAVDESWRQRGGDPDIAARLPGLMAAHGLQVTEIRPLHRIGRPGSPLWQWPVTFFRNYLPVLVQLGLLSPEERQAFERDWQQWERNPSAYFCTPPMCDIIGVKR